MTIAELRQKDSFKNLSKELQQEVLCMMDVGSAMIPIAVDVGARPVNEKEELLLQETVKIHESQIGTLLGVLTGPTGTEGIVSDIKEIKNLLSNMNDRFSSLDKTQAIMDEKNQAAHARMRNDIDGIGRKSEHAAKKADKVEADFEEYRREQLNKVDAEIDKKKESRFKWYHAVLALLGFVVVVVELLQVVAI